jgi:hypothetical protein
MKNRQTLGVHYKNFRTIFFNSICILFSLAVATMNAYALGQNDTVCINLRSGMFGINYDPVVQHIYMWLDKHNARYDNDWEIKQITPDIYQMRNKAWKVFFWQINTSKKVAAKINNGSFGSLAGTEKILEDTSVLIFKQNDPARIPPFGLRFKNAQMEYNQTSHKVTIIAEGAVVSPSDDWVTSTVDASTLHIRNARPNLFVGQPSFFKIDTAQTKIYRVMDGNFGAPGGNEQLLSEEVRVLKSDLLSMNEVVEEDMGVKWAQPTPLSSTWTDSEKARYRTLLKQGTYDVLVVPFQVQGYAIDRPGRSLMTRYLIQRIERTTNSKFPSHTLISRALGESARTYSDSEIYSLANDLNVKVLIKGYVGHHRDEKMNVTLLVQIRDDSGAFKPSGRTLRIERKGIPFSDQHLPSEAFSDMLDDLIRDLPFKQLKKAQPATYKKEKQITVPTAIKAMTSRTPDSPVFSAYYLQFLGMLYPEETVAREHLFERSLVALREVSPQSPDYSVLKARAYFYLYRRPAALAALSSPSSPEEQALLAVLNGNLPMLKQAVRSIKEPLPKLIAQIELNDLLWQYDQFAAKKNIKEIAKSYPGWEMILTRRMKTNDVWSDQSNLHVKKILDDALPIRDYTVDTLALSSVTRGDSLYDNTDLEFSVYNHYVRLLKEQGRKFAANDSAFLVERDILDLLAAVGESNLMKKALLRIRTQALYEDGLSLLDIYAPLYQGHPQVSYLRSAALYAMARTKQGGVADNLTKTAKELAYQACWLSQGQNINSYNMCSTLTLYDADYPRRSYWNPPAASAYDRILSKTAFKQFPSTNLSSENLYTLQNLEQSLRYTHTGFLYLETYHAKLRELKLFQAADDLLKKNAHRFSGNTLLTAFLAKLKEKNGDILGAQKIYEETIDSAQTSWAPYRDLGWLYIKQGNFKKASATFNNYPLFRLTTDGHGDDEDVDTVALANNAHNVGRLLWSRGALEESVSLLKRSTDYQTGAGSGMRSATILALIGKNYYAALQSSLATAKRYNLTSDYIEYIRLLHMMGYHKEAWAVWNTLPLNEGKENIWSVVILGHQMEGKLEHNQLEWFVQNAKETTSLYSKQQYVFLSHTVDRSPNETVSELVERIGQSADHGTKTRANNTPAPNKKEKTFLAWFADGYFQLQKKNFKEAYAIFKNRFTNDNYILTSGHILPYFVWSSIKSGGISEIEPYIQKYADHYGEDFDYHIIKAFMYAGQKKDAEAINHLRAAQYVLPEKLEERAVYPLYQLLEACEWLYEETKNNSYLALGLTWAKLYQHVQPMTAWTYSFEAKYTTNKEDRLKALALTLYFDRRSNRIAAFSDQDKIAATEWLKSNNPFTNSFTQVRKKEI